ncbi:hypothetical protein BGZ54_002367 [Gamsiella multidivaricata]|nr:hypothetical protein BGZ54_002367 [Gamsiella multidivaricata]
MAEDRLKLFCLVSGDPVSRAFSVIISSGSTVDDLRESIKIKKTPEFDDIAADALNSPLARPQTIADKFLSRDSNHARFLNEFMRGSHDLPVTEGVGLRNLERRPLYYSSICSAQVTREHLSTLRSKFWLITLEFAIFLSSETWGLYFNTDAKDYGSNDMRTIIDTLSLQLDIYLSENKEHNTDRMLLQVATPAFEDAFQSLFEVISRYFHEHLVSSFIAYIVQDQLLDRTEASALPHFKFLLVLDEAQILGRFPDNTSLDSDRKTSRPV